MQTGKSLLPEQAAWPATRHGRWMSASCVPGLVSVIVPTYNRAALLVETLESVFAQTYRPIELLVVDDGSTDDTREVVARFAAAHSDDDQFTLRYLKQENSGAPAARNLGLIESTGEYIQFLDSDDILHPSKFERQARAFEEHPAASFVYSYTTVMDATGKSIGHYPTGGWHIEALSPAAILEGSIWLLHSGLFHRDACRRMGPWDESIRLWQDWEYGSRLAMLGVECRHVPAILSYYRRHAGERISQKKPTLRTFEMGCHTLQAMAMRARLMTDYNRRIRCALAASFLRSMTIPLMEDCEEAIALVSKEIRALDPCPVCRMRLAVVLLSRRIIGGKRTATLLALTRKVLGRLFSLHGQALWRLGAKRVRPRRWPLHL